MRRGALRLWAGAAHDAAVAIRAALVLLAIWLHLARTLVSAVVDAPLLHTFCLGRLQRVAAVDGATWVRAPGVSSPHPTGDLPVLGDRRHAKQRCVASAPQRASRPASAACAVLPWPVLCLLVAHAHGRSQLIDEACVLFCAQAQRAGAALKKGEKRVRAFGGVYAFPVQNRQLLEVGAA